MDGEHFSGEVVCRSCGHEWVAIAPVSASGVIPLECPNCGHLNQIAVPTPPLHFVVSHFNQATWLKPSRPVRRQEAIALLSEALFMLNSSDAAVLLPEDCTLQAWLTVNDGQLPPEQ